MTAPLAAAPSVTTPTATSTTLPAEAKEPSNTPRDEPAIGDRGESWDGFLVGSVAGTRPASADNAMSYLLVTRWRFFGMLRDTISCRGRGRSAAPRGRAASLFPRMSPRWSPRHGCA